MTDETKPIQIDKPIPPTHKQKPLLLLSIIAAVGIAVGFVIWEWWSDSPAPPPTKPVIVKPYQPPNVMPYLDKAANKSEEALEPSLQDIRDFFEEAKKGTRPFAGIALGFWSKIKLATDYVPFTRGNRNAKYISAEFEKRIFSGDGLINAIEQAVNNYNKRVEYIENDMLTEMRNDLPETQLFKTLNQEQILEVFRQKIADVIAESQNSTTTNLTTDIVQLITVEVLTQVAVRLGVSAGILSAGAASSLYTFGISVVVGIIIDAAISWVWNWYADPVGELAKKIDRQLDEICTLIIDGAVADGDKSAVIGLRQKLLEYSKQRGEFRTKTVHSLLQPQTP